MKSLVNSFFSGSRLGLANLTILVAVISLETVWATGTLAAGARKIPSTVGLPVAKSSQVVHVKNGDAIEITAGFVKDKVGKRWMTRLAYNGMIPGPMIVAPKGL